MTAAVKLAREYELVYILRPTVTPSEAKKVADRVAEVIDRGDAQLTRVDNWGRRRLAYTIRTAAGRHTRGIFIYVRFVGNGDVINELERNLRILDQVIRFQTVRLEGLYDLSALDVDPEEIAFCELEEADDDEDDEPSFEESLGMRQPEPVVEASTDEEAPEGEKAAEGGEGEAEEGKAEEGKAEEAAPETASAEGAEAASASTDEEE